MLIFLLSFLIYYVGTPPNCTITSTTECHSNPCRNGGTCSYDMIQNTFNCSCPPGFTGMSALDLKSL